MLSEGEGPSRNTAAPPVIAELALRITLGKAAGDEMQARSPYQHLRPCGIRNFRRARPLLKPGKHTIRVSLTGYRDWTRDISTDAGASVHLTATLEKASQ